MDPSSAANFLKVAMRAALRGILAERLGHPKGWSLKMGTSKMAENQWLGTHFMAVNL